MDLPDIKRRIFKDEDGWNNYMNVSIEEMDWLVEQAEKLEKVKTLISGNKISDMDYVYVLYRFLKEDGVI